ncbi:SGNH/GDSL hydrolase family protein, partial [Candidatus Sumerlaeota bacterium]|nr:SGNH/GDSL hydrolase family protein [Candidatus Sumerlaeota bacterium]
AGTIAGLIYFGEKWADQRIAKIPDWVASRQIMMGTVQGEKGYINFAQNVVGQAYLLYIPSPSDAENSPMGHNQHGYRGPIVPINKTPGVVRILFVGGSTTYGWAVQNYHLTYPAQLGELLSKRLPPYIKGVEVINSGVPFGTSAEEFTHYHFKFHYYHPDIVVINSGGNDAVADNWVNYHPDYSHWRHPLINVRPLPERCRWVMKSKMLSLFMLECFQYDGVSAQTFTPNFTDPPLAPWFEDKYKEVIAKGPIPEEYLGFKHNLESLLQEVKDDGAKPLLVAFRANPNNVYPPELNTEIARLEEVVKKIAAERDVPLAPFPASVISPENWADGHCHLFAGGEKQKAEHVLPYVMKLLPPPPPGWTPADGSATSEATPQEAEKSSGKAN